MNQVNRLALLSPIEPLEVTRWRYWYLSKVVGVETTSLWGTVHSTKVALVSGSSFHDPIRAGKQAPTRRTVSPITP